MNGDFQKYESVCRKYNSSTQATELINRQLIKYGKKEKTEQKLSKGVNLI